MINSKSHPLPYKSNQGITRMDEIGVPSLVQRLYHDPTNHVYRAYYFDGSTVALPSPIRVTALGQLITQPTETDWLAMEDTAIAWYARMRDLARDLGSIGT